MNLIEVTRLQLMNFLWGKSTNNNVLGSSMRSRNIDNAFRYRDRQLCSESDLSTVAIPCILDFPLVTRIAEKKGRSV